MAPLLVAPLSVAPLLVAPLPVAPLLVAPLSVAPLLVGDWRSNRCLGHRGHDAPQNGLAAHSHTLTLTIGRGCNGWAPTFLIRAFGYVPVQHVPTHRKSQKGIFKELVDTARYTGQLLAPAEGFGRGFFLLFGQKRPYYAVLANFWPFLASSSNLGNF